MWPTALALLLLTACLSVNRLDAPPQEAREIAFNSAGYRLAGTLTLPRLRPVAAGILIIPGSGPIDRDGVSRASTSVPPIYRRWAEDLGAAGFAVLRYDKRFVTHPDINVAAFDQEAQIADAVAAVAFLRSAPDIAGGPMFIVGHSEGGTLAPIVAERAGDVAGVVLVNAVLFPVDELLVAQLDANPTLPRPTVSEVRRQLDRIKDGSFPRNGLLLGAGAAYWRQWIELSSATPARLSGFPIALLVVQSLNDETLPGETLARNLAVARTVAAGNRKAKLREMPGHDHFARRAGQDASSPEFVEALVGWLRTVR